MIYPAESTSLPNPRFIENIMKSKFHGIEIIFGLTFDSMNSEYLQNRYKTFILPLNFGIVIGSVKNQHVSMLIKLNDE
jgi:hypothetical protein